ncbi:short chain dehydrogenase [Rhodoligotrophos defluvii]|uniref:short chain dehydrogenase n=1 Tax=Rhodoligotrophos defluvii TaxID=2561934 RepID=UPI0010CA04A4|nr:short chain dehydrogenase [Rhodoligotrophos defluvii]
MKILVVGASGVVGKAVVANLSQRHHVLQASRSQSPFKVDMTSPTSIRALYEEVGSVDAVVAATGHVKFAPLENMSDADYRIGLNDKLMGQVNLVVLGIPYVASGGSFTLTSGILTDEPILGGTSASMVNGALESFTRAAAIELPRGLRINIVNATVLEEALGRYGEFFAGIEAAPGHRVALAYQRSVEGRQTGQVYYVR